MSTPPGAEPPFALDGTVTRDKLLELLGVQAELAWLDYKVECDLGNKGDTVAIAKDVGAMRIRSGYLVIGVDNAGVPVGISEAHAKLFDEATLRPKLARYVGTGGELRTVVHDLDDGSGPVRLALVWVGPHPDGFCIFACDGQYTDRNGKLKIDFYEGQVYARHGTSSEAWDQSDVAEIRIRLVAREKDSWRAEHAEQTGRLLAAAAAQTSVVHGPSAAFTWELDAAGFEDAAVELLRGDDDVPVRRMLWAARADAERLLPSEDAGDAADLVVLLDRLTTLAALGLSLRRPGYFAMSLEALLGLYDLGLIRFRANAPGPHPARLWLRLAERLYALGALAVRLEEWPGVRRLALAPVPGLAAEPRWRTWHRHALTSASRHGLLQEDTTNGPRRRSLLHFARAVAAADPALRPDLPTPSSDPDILLASIAAFDFLATVISVAAAGATTSSDLLAVAYPNYALADSAHTAPVAARLVSDEPMRTALLPEVTDASLAGVLDLAEHIAKKEEDLDYFHWDNGYADPAVFAFIAAHLTRPHLGLGQ